MLFKIAQAPAEEKLVKLMENTNPLLVCSEKFCHSAYNAFVEPGTAQNNFVKNLYDATFVKLNNDPFQGLALGILNYPRYE